VLVVEDDLAVGKVLVSLLTQGGIDAEHVPSADRALLAIEKAPYDVVVTDLKMPGMDGMALLRQLRDSHDMPVIMITAHGNVQLAVEAMKAGAAEFMSKPFDREEVLFTVRKALASTSHQAGAPPRAPAQSSLMGKSPAMHEVSDLVERAARTMANVLVRGETGTGKEVAARAIHDRGPRRAHDFVAVNCAALPDQLLESELFGYEKGAFTGAVGRKPGRVELAEGGTLFLDEIGDISPAVQAKLLRLLQEKEYQPLGGTRTHKADVRFIAATHRDLEEMVAENEFREDLLYRLDVIPVWMPPLRERPDDVGLLAEHFTKKLAKDNHRPGLTLSKTARQQLTHYDWPGNVRELMNFIERLVVFSDGETIESSDVERELERAGRRGGSVGGAGACPGDGSPSSGPSPPSGSLEGARHDAEKQAVLDALRRAGDNRTQAARLLGISRRKLYNLLAQLDIA